MADQVAAAMHEVEATTVHLGGIAMAGDIEAYMSGATAYLRMFSRLIFSWLFLWQSTIAQKALAPTTSSSDERYYKGKLATARAYLNNELPYLHAAAQILKAGERTALDFDRDWF